MRRLDSQRVLLQAQLAQIGPNSQVFTESGQRVFGAEDRLKSLKSTLASLKARYAPGHPDIVAAEREVAGLEKEVKSEDDTADRLRQLSEAKAQLASAREKYSADHPDVVRLQRVIDGLSKDVAAGGCRRLPADAAAHADNPVYIQVKGQLDALSVDATGRQKAR